MKNQPQKSAQQSAKSSGKTAGEKRQTVFIFTCIGGILYVVPALSAVFLGVTADGMSMGFILGIVAVVLGIPNSLFAMHAFSKRKFRPFVIAAASVLIALHLVCLPMLGAWYFILSPALILLVLMIVFSSVIENH